MTTRNVTLQSTLKDSSGIGVSAESIAFEYRLTGAPTYTSAGAATTNASGIASVTIALTVPNTYDFESNFAGDANYDASTASVNGFRVTGTTTLNLVVTPN